MRKDFVTMKSFFFVYFVRVKNLSGNLNFLKKVNYFTKLDTLLSDLGLKNIIKYM